MKKIALLLFIGFVSLSINAQEKTTTVQDSNAPVFEFVADVIDYGTIELNADGLRVFKFKNVESRLLNIESKNCAKKST